MKPLPIWMGIELPLTLFIVCVVLNTIFDLVESKIWLWITLRKAHSFERLSTNDLAEGFNGWSATKKQERYYFYKWVANIVHRWTADAIFLSAISIKWGWTCISCSRNQMIALQCCHHWQIPCIFFSPIVLYFMHKENASTDACLPVSDYA